MGTPAQSPLRDELFQAWQHFGWRFQEDRLHPGMSDRAWLIRDGLSASLRSTVRSGNTATRHPLMVC
jgi:hypothetical protein